MCSCSKDTEVATADNYTSTEKETLPPYKSGKKSQEKTEYDNSYEYASVISPTKTDDGYEITVAGGNGKDVIKEKSDSYAAGTRPSSDGIIIE